MRAMITPRVGPGTVWTPFHFGGWFEGKDLYETFNMGVGFVFATPEPERLGAQLSALKQPFWKIGHVSTGAGRAVVQATGMAFIC